MRETSITFSAVSFVFAAHFDEKTDSRRYVPEYAGFDQTEFY